MQSVVTPSSNGSLQARRSGGDTCTRCGMVLVDARGGGTNRRAMGREIRQKAGRAGCARCNAETGCCRVASRRPIQAGHEVTARSGARLWDAQTDAVVRTLWCSRATQSRLRSFHCPRPQGSPIVQEPRSLSSPPCHPTARSPPVRPLRPPEVRQRPGRPRPQTDDVPSR